MASIKARASEKGGVVTVKALVSHPMETGTRKDKKTGKKIPAHFIQELVCEHGGKSVVVAQLGPAVSKNPYVSIKFSGGKKGDTIKLSWVDNKGEKDATQAKIR